MATLADRPLSDIIDLDIIDPDFVEPRNAWLLARSPTPVPSAAPRPRPRPRPRQQPTDVIVIDSDDDDNVDDEVQIIRHVVPLPARHNPTGAAARNNVAGPSAPPPPRRRNYFSPPPPPQHNAVPPVPPLPRYLPDPGLAARHGPPHGPNRRPFPDDAGVIRPSLHAPEFGPRTDGQHNANANIGRVNGIGHGRGHTPQGAPGPNARTNAPQAALAPRDRSPDIPGAWVDIPPAAQAQNQARNNNNNDNGGPGRMGLGGGLMTRNGRPPAGIGGVGNFMGRVRADWNAIWGFVDNPWANENQIPEIAHILDRAHAMTDDWLAGDGRGDRHAALAAHMRWEDEERRLELGLGPGGGQYARMHRPLVSVRDYEERFTHPLPAEKGFTHDFAVPEVLLVSDSPGPSSPMKSSPRHTLACVRCRDPLVMNMKGSEEETKKRRLWTLRCGHVLDGKCVEDLMQPAPLPLLKLDEEGRKLDVKGKGKAVDNPTSDNRSPLLQKLGELAPHTSPSKNRKGKGRAVPEPLPTPFPMQTTTGSEDNPSSGVRSRLRPRPDSTSASRARAGTNPASLSNILNSPSASPATLSHPLPAYPPLSLSSSSRITRARSGSSATSATLPRRPGGFPRSARPPSGSGPTATTTGANRKGKGSRARGGGRKGRGGRPVIEEEFEWFCPVDGCLKEHRSVRVGGEWRGDEGRGAVPLFV